MESTGSCTRSTAPAAAELLAIREDGSKLAQRKSPATPSPAPPSASAGFKCKFCPLVFESTRPLAGHQKAHRDLLDQISQSQIQEEHPPAAPHVRGVSSGLSNILALGGPAYLDFHTQLFNSCRARMHILRSPTRSALVPLFAGAGGLVPVQPSAAAIGGGGHAGTSRQVNQKENSQYFLWLPQPSFIPQTQTGSGLPPPSIDTPALVAEGDGGTGDVVHLGRPQHMPEANEEETTDGIDLTPRL